MIKITAKITFYNLQLSKEYLTLEPRQALVVVMGKVQEANCLFYLQMDAIFLDFVASSHGLTYVPNGIHPKHRSIADMISGHPPSKASTLPRSYAQRRKIGSK